LCLIGLQLIAPFIHAHAFGLDTFNERTLHIHADIAPLADIQVASLHKGDLHTAANSHAIVYDNLSDQQSGYIITVASGVNSPVDANAMLNPLIGIALLMIFALMLMQLAPSLIFSTTPSLALRQLSYPTQNPRAPPR
jgi:hypothetical protein